MTAGGRGGSQGTGAPPGRASARVCGGDAGTWARGGVRSPRGAAAPGPAGSRCRSGFKWLLFRVPSPPPPGRGPAGSAVTRGLAGGTCGAAQTSPRARGWTRPSLAAFASPGPWTCTPLSLGNPNWSRRQPSFSLPTGPSIFTDWASSRLDRALQTCRNGQQLSRVLRESGIRAPIIKNKSHEVSHQQCVSRLCVLERGRATSELSALVSKQENPS